MVVKNIGYYAVVFGKDFEIVIRTIGVLSWKNLLFIVTLIDNRINLIIFSNIESINLSFYILRLGYFLWWTISLLKEKLVLSDWDFLNRIILD